MKNEYNKKKIEGATFTPQELANFLARHISHYLLNTDANLIVSDPSCGDGALLDAISSVLIGKDIKFELQGCDVNEEYVNSTNLKLKTKYSHIKTSLCVQDFIVERVNTLHSNVYKNDIIIANPPYVRTQIIGAEKAQMIAKQYDLSGRVDLYYPFLINMTESLVDGGILGVITSNRYLTTKSGEAIRKYLLQNYDILEIIDLGDTKLFDASVLPAIFIGRKNSHSDKKKNGRFYKIYETTNNNLYDYAKTAKDICSILDTNKVGIYKVSDKYYDFSCGYFNYPSDENDIWGMTTFEEKEWLDTVNKNCSFHIGDRFSVRVGIKSCADDVFFYSDWSGDIQKPEDDFFKPMISQENIIRWHSPKNLDKVIYPHFENKNGQKDVLDIDLFQKAKSFFLSNENRLKSRKYLLKTKSRRWYEYWVPQNCTLWKYIKVVFADISIEPRFVIDKSGAIVNGNCYWFEAKNQEEEDMLYLIVGIANTKFIERYHDLSFNNKLYSGRRRYLTQYVEKYPIPPIDSEYSQEIIQITREIFNTELEESSIKQKEERLEILTRNAFGFMD